MIECTVAPDWSPFQFEQGRFEVIHSLLNDFEKRISKEGTAVDRTEYLAQCHCESERNIMLQEMDYLTALQSQPVKFVGGCLIIRTVAVGGFGVVSLGVDQDGRSVAVKVSHLSWQLAKNRDELDEEAMILKELNHPNIVEFISCGYDDNWYLITEWVNGYNLQDAIKKIRAPLVQWLDVFSQVCDALEYGHRQGIIHRDINLRNIMVTGNGKPVAKVLDYGVAKRNNLAQSNSEHVKGTRKFIAPEQYQGKCDERSDIYALGVTLQEVVESQYSHPGRVPRQLRAVINKATARSLAKRYQSAGEVRSAIRNVADRISTGEYPIVYQRNHSMVVAAVCMAVVIVALLGAFLAKGWIFGSEADPVAILTDSNNQVEMEDVQPIPGNVGEVPINPLILLETDPPGAELVFYRLEKNGPDPDKGIKVGFAGSSQNIPPGDYLVVAMWPDGEWIEVLRRVPDQKTYNNLPTSSFDWFRRELTGIILATIRRIPVSKTGMHQSNGFWVDIEMSKPTSKRFAESSFSYACQELEAQGKRLPFSHELQQCRDSSEIQISDDEWTCSLVRCGLYTRSAISKQEITFQDNSFIVFTPGIDNNRYELSETKSLGNCFVGFRGIRNLKPFGPSSY